MKNFTIDIHPKLKCVTFSVKNGRKFSEALIIGNYASFKIDIAPEDIKRVKQFAVRIGNDKRSCRGNWYAHCNGYAMDLTVMNAGSEVYINTYRAYGASK